MQYKWWLAKIVDNPVLDEYLEATMGKGICTCETYLDQKYMFIRKFNKCIIHQKDSLNIYFDWNKMATEYFSNAD